MVVLVLPSELLVGGFKSFQRIIEITNKYFICNVINVGNIIVVGIKDEEDDALDDVGDATFPAGLVTGDVKEVKEDEDDETVS